MTGTSWKRFRSAAAFGAGAVFLATSLSAWSAPEAPPNRFGLMPGKASLIPAAKELGVRYYRPVAIRLEDPDLASREADAAAEAGFRLVLSIRASGGNREASGPPKDVHAFRSALARVLDRYRPEILVVENEENSRLFYGGSAAEYLEELKVACQVAHAKGIKCTNGGLVSSLVIFLLADHLKQTGQAGAAEQALRDGLGYKFQLPRQPAPGLELLGRPKVAEQVALGRQLLAGYRAAGADYVNFHWYSPDTRTLRKVVPYLEKATGLPAISNEVGQQRTEDPAQVTRLLAALDDLKLPVAIWFSMDIQGHEEARSLFSPDGRRRPNGQAFADYLRKYPR